jgi:hypothetical protein
MGAYFRQNATDDASGEIDGSALMKKSTALLSAAVAFLSTGVAFATDDPPKPPPSPEAVAICAALGPGYKPVGLNTCLKVSGYVQFDAAAAPSSGGSQPASPKPH